jgi:hydroxypyruvate reductase
MTTAVLRADARACFDAALAAVEPARLVDGRLRRRGDALVLADAGGGEVARHAGPVLVVGAGKAALAMGAAAAAAAGDACRGGRLIVPHAGTGPCPGGVDVATGRHPVPDDAGVAATAGLLDLVARADTRTLVVAVLSGGASALLVAPAPGIALADKQAVTAALLAAGAPIETLNLIRRHCSRVKGGGLARAAAGAAGLWALLLSDVVGDDPAVIGSGPAAADPTTFADAMTALARHLRADAVPPTVLSRLARGAAGELEDTVKPGDPVLERVRNVLIGDNRTAVDAAARAAAERGLPVEVVGEPIVGDASAAGRVLARRVLALPRGGALVAGGETTVRAAAGRGGRAQHLALAAALELAGTPAVLLAAGTDGVDGPTDAAGACVDGETVARARTAGLDPEAALAATDSHTLLAGTGDLVRTGPTGTNVADVVVALRPAW